MESYISSTTFEIIDDAFIYRGWSVRGDHMYKETPEGICFGETEILLRLVDGEPKLTVPEGQNAELLQADHAFRCGERVDGRFVKVRIS